MKFLIDDFDGETVEVDLAECRTLYPNQSADVLYVNGVPCKLSSARSVEVVGIREAVDIFRQLVDMTADRNAELARALVDEWLAIWGDV